MRILLVTDAYPPEIRSASHLMVELAEELHVRGHEVIVVTSYPEYNLDDSSRSQRWDECTREGAITVIRVKTLPHHNVNFLVRGVSQITMPRLFLAAVRRHISERIDASIVYSPPLPLAKVGSILKRTKGTRFVLNVQDIFPQNAVDLGVLKNPVLIRFFETMERRAYRNADAVTVHSEGNRRFLLERGRVASGTLSVLHNWIDVDAVRAADGKRDFREEYGLHSSFIFLFAGVMGPSQGLDMVLNVAEITKDLSDVVFLLVGDGMEKERLVARAARDGLSNVIFKPFVSKEAYAALVNSVDVGVVSLTSRNKTPVVPGKILGYMAAGKPVLAYLNAESDGHELLRDARCGVSVVSDRTTEELAVAACELYGDRAKLRELGENGRRYVTENFEKRVCVDEIERLLTRQ